MRTPPERTTTEPRGGLPYVDGIRKHIGAYATVLEGLDCQVFGGRIGENGPEIRKAALRRLEFMGLRWAWSATRCKASRR